MLDTLDRFVISDVSGRGEILPRISMRCKENDPLLKINTRYAKYRGSSSPRNRRGKIVALLIRATRIPRNQIARTDDRQIGAYKQLNSTCVGNGA